MPSHTSPTSLQIGPGRLSPNVVSASSYQAPAEPPSAAGDSLPAVVSVVETTTLTRESAVMHVIVDTRARIFAIPGSLLVDGETFTLNDSANTPTVFEFDSNGSVTGGRVAVPFTGSSTAAQVASAIRTAVNSVGGTLFISAGITIGHIVPLTQDTEQPIVISDTVANAGFKYFTFDRTNYTVTLPAEPKPGDVVHFLPDGGAKHHRNLVIIDGGGAQINGSTNGEYLGGSYGAQSYTYGFNGGWITSTESVATAYVNASTTLQRTSRNMVVLVDSSAGAVVVTLPNAPLLGDRVTVLRLVPSSNAVTVQGWSAFDSIDERSTGTVTTLAGDFSSVTLVRVNRLKWATLSETTNVIETTTSLTLNGLTSAREIHILVRTNDAAWALSSRTISSPNSQQVRKGSIVTITDVDGGAAANPILTFGGVLGVSSPTSASQYTIDTPHGSVTLVSKGGTIYSIAAESYGVADNFSSLSRADTRSDSAMARLRPSPMFNWSERKVAIHAEFAGLITNFFPVDGFTAGGTMVLSKVPVSGLTGTVGVLRTTTTGGTVGYLHLGSLPTDTLFDPAQLLGFRAILTAQTTAPGSNYDVLVGFGDDISEAAGSEDQKMGSNGLYVITGSTGFWRSVRQAAGTATGANSTGVGAVVAGNRYVIEFYGTVAAGWSLYVNGTRFFAGTANVPTAKLNFGMQVLNGAGGMDYVVDVDSFTVFTQDMGTTRHNP